MVSLAIFISSFTILEHSAAEPVRSQFNLFYITIKNLGFINFFLPLKRICLSLCREIIPPTQAMIDTLIWKQNDHHYGIIFFCLILDGSISWFFTSDCMSQRVWGENSPLLRCKESMQIHLRGSIMLFCFCSWHWNYCHLCFLSALFSQETAFY